MSNYTCPSCKNSEFELLPITNIQEGITLTFVCDYCDYYFNVTYEHFTRRVTDTLITLERRYTIAD